MQSIYHLFLEIRNGNQAFSSKLDSKTAEITQPISGLKTILDKAPVWSKRKSEISTAGDQLVELASHVNKLSKENYFLMEKVD